jgi:hypothetical protein
MPLLFRSAEWQTDVQKCTVYQKLPTMEMHFPAALGHGASTGAQHGDAPGGGGSDTVFAVCVERNSFRLAEKAENKRNK